MFLDSLSPQPIPTVPWINKVQVDDWIWLVKENEPAQVIWPWTLVKPYSVNGVAIIPDFGRIGLGRMWRSGARWGFKEQQTWGYIRLLGTGNDGKPLFAPTKKYIDFVAIESATVQGETEARFQEIE